MRKIIRKDSNNINYALIFDLKIIHEISDKFLVAKKTNQRYLDVVETNLYSMFDKSKQIHYEYSIWPKNFAIGDFVIDFLNKYCVISQRVYDYLFIDNPEMSINILAKPIDIYCLPTYNIVEQHTLVDNI